MHRMTGSIQGVEHVSGIGGIELTGLGGLGQGHRQVVRNGYHNERKVTTGLGQVEVKQPRVHDRRPAEEREKFTSKILPPYLRKTKSIEELLPWLYLKGISTGDMNEALQSLLGPECPGLSASTVTSLKKSWEEDFKQWNARSLEGKRYVYVWADGVHFNIRLEEDRQCILVLMGVTPEGKKELIAVQDGFRESEQSWKELLLDVKARGLAVDPELATGDGALGKQPLRRDGLTSFGKSVSESFILMRSPMTIWESRSTPFFLRY